MAADVTRHEALADITRALLSHRFLPDLFAALGEILRELFPEADDFGIARYHADHQVFQVLIADVDDGHPVTNMGVKTRDTEDTPGGFLMRQRRTVMINDMDAFESQSGLDFRNHFPRTFASGIGALLEHGGEVLGYIYLSSGKKNVFGEQHRDLLEAARGVLSLAFANAIAFEELENMRVQAQREGEYLREEIDASWPADGLVGRSPAWKSVLHQITQVARTDSTVLIHGETGTGKEVIARAIHERSRRSNKPLIKVNCGALPENLVESELFGHERGAFTGALGRRIGRFELADGGTIFLDEIGEMPPALQVKLLRVLQEREFERVGGEKPIRVNVRVLAATNKKLEEEVKKGNFREDLFYRLNVFPIQRPPLRERPEDAEELAKYFLDKLGTEMGRRPLRFSAGSIEALRAYHWPGNVRELQHLIERGIILCNRSEVDIAGLLNPGSVRVAQVVPVDLGEPARAVSEGRPVSLKESFTEAERAAIETALAECNGVVGGKYGAAARLGLKRQTLQSKMKKLGISLGKSRGGAPDPPSSTAV
jgi:formate hydrogenlyase transcriptional activator